MEKWLDFYGPFFPSEEEARRFVDSCEQLVPPNNVAKIMMHQGQRLVSLADDFGILRPHHEALQILPLMMCAENISKLHAGFEEEGQSRAHARRFFERFLTDADKNTLTHGFTHNGPPETPYELGEVIDLMYGIRCDVVHEGKYWGFAFHDGDTPMLNTEPDVTSYITYGEFRSVIVRSCVRAVQERLPAP